MVTDFSRFKLKNERERIRFLVFSIIALWALILLWEFFAIFTLATFIKIAVVGAVLVGLYRSVENYHYTFWSMASILAIVSLYGVWSTLFLGAKGSSAAYFLTFVLVAILARVLFSPIYYPLVSWWEYDFRYRFDLKVKITHYENGKEKELEGRLTDFRRKAAGVCCFEKLNIGELVTLEFEGEFHSHKFEGEVMSRRYYLIGRPIVYGVKLNLNGEDSKRLTQEYSEFCSFWRRSKRAKEQKRFKEV